MRIYFRHARTVYTFSTQLLDEALLAPSSLRDRFQGWRSRHSHRDFLVAGGRLVLRQPALVKDPRRLMSTFEFIAAHGVKLSREAEEQVREALPAVAGQGAQFPELGKHLRQILVAPHAAEALRAMHSTGLLVRLFPEFAAIDLLVIRDFYHHYTVDAHSFMAIENIHRLRHPVKSLRAPLPGEIFRNLKQPELLFLSILFHDVGKGMPSENHVVGSLEAVERAFPRLDLRPEEADTIRFLIRDHLAMSANLLRRDIFDPETIRAFAEQVGTPERLKLLCLFTYADIRAVNPEALTPWKAESLWQLYVSTANYMSRSLDEERIHAEAHDLQFVSRIMPLLAGSATLREVSAFLGRLTPGATYSACTRPRKWPRTFKMARQLDKKAVESNTSKKRGQNVCG